MINTSANSIAGAAPSHALERNGGRRFVMIGGFLGAGKTTCVAALAAHLKQLGCRPGLVTNGQGEDLVDTTTLRTRGWTTEETIGGCFATRFTGLTAAAERLAAAQVDVLVAEPLGTCADLLATVSYPLREIYGKDLQIAPLSVVLDPARAGVIFGLEKNGRTFSESIRYIYEKQLEEAEILVINKTDLFPRELIGRLRMTLQERFPNREIYEISARTGAGFKPWFERVLSSHQAARAPLAIDYEAYAEGEGRLGWSNSSVGLSSRRYFDSSKVLMHVATAIQAQLKEAGAEVGHLKMSLSPEDGVEGFGFLSLVRNDHVPELAEQVSEPIESGRLRINLRAEANPELLNSAVTNALLAVVETIPHLFARMEYSEHFRPPRPDPAHRIQDAP